jgi:O-antigen ligase
MAAPRTAPPATGGATWRDRVDELLAGSPSFVPALICVGVFIWFGADEGGFRGVTFLPGALLILGLLAVSLVSLPWPRPSRAAMLAVALLGAYAAWSYLSIAWADEQGPAWDGANRTVLYALVLALFALWPMRAGGAAVLLGAFGLGVAVLALVEILRAESASVATQYFHGGRLGEPTGYANANVGLWFSAFWPCLVLAGRREVPAVFRGLLLGGAGLLAAVAVLGQSRGWFFVLPVVAVLVVALVPGRARTILALAVVGAGVALILDPLLDVYEAIDSNSPPGPAFSPVVDRILLLTGALTVIGTLVALVDRRVELPPRAAHRMSVAMVALFFLTCAGGVAAIAIVKGNPATELSDAWDKFKEGGDEASGSSSSRFDSIVSYRYDYWKVAWDAFERHPVAGIGVDNFSREYYLRGKSIQTPKYPHSVEVRTLAQTGLIGSLLLGGAIVAVLWAAAPVLRPGFGLAGAAAGAGIMVFAYWFTQGSVDWFWEFPGLGAPAFAMVGLAAAVAAARQGARGSALPGGRPIVAGAVVLGLVTAGGLTVPWLAERDLRAAREIAASNPERALDRLNRSADVNPLSTVADKTAAVIELRRGRRAAGKARFEDVAARDPGDSYVWMQLGAIASVEMRERDAARYARKARALAPRDEVVRRVAPALEAGKVVDPERVNRLALESIERRIGPE